MTRIILADRCKNPLHLGWGLVINYGEVGLQNSRGGGLKRKFTPMKKGEFVLNWTETVLAMLKAGHKRVTCSF